MKSIKLPKNLKKIGVESFCRCYSLESIELPDTIKVIEQRAFRWCTNLK